MNCPECKTETLGPTRLEPSLGAFGCSNCEGALLSLLSYRVWQEHHAHEAGESSTIEKTPAEPGKALVCAKCQRLMLRFRYTLDTNHVLDVCTHCDDVWLQAHEWTFLKARSLHGDLPHIFTEPWQQQRRTEQQQAAFNNEWNQRLGPSLHAELMEIRGWLDHHPQREEILRYLNSKNPYRV